MLYFFCALAVVLSIVTIIMQNKGLFGVKFLVKSLASFSFLTAGLIALLSPDTINKWQILIVVGLAFGLMGDIFLATKRVVKDELVDVLLLAGLIFFALGHVIYIAVFIILSGSYIYPLFALIAIFPIIMFLMIKKGAIAPGRAKIPILAYTVVIGVMLTLALSYMITSDFSVRGIVFFCAAVLFMASDTLLGFYNFGKEGVRFSDTISAIYMPFYYIAQALFAISIIL